MVAFTGSFWEEYLGTEGGFFPGKDSAVCADVVWWVGKWKELSWYVAFSKGMIVTNFTTLAALSFLPLRSQLAYSRAFLAFKQGLSILPFSELWRWWMESQWGPGPTP